MERIKLADLQSNHGAGEQGEARQGAQVLHRREWKDGILGSLANSLGEAYGTGSVLDRPCRHDSSRRTKSATASG